jgi:hypothetical protein
METIGPDCTQIIMDYKKSFDFVFKQQKNVIDILRYKWVSNRNRTLVDLDLYYEDFKELFKNCYKDTPKIINFTLNAYGPGHRNNHKIFQLDLRTDDDSMLYEYRVISLHKDKNDELLIKLYNKKYDYDFLDRMKQKCLEINKLQLEDEIHPMDLANSNYNTPILNSMEEDSDLDVLLI